MSLNHLLDELNKEQLKAACMSQQHALVLAGAGTGKTKTIVARAAYLIANGTPADRIQILAFTRRSASEIVERVKLHLGDEAKNLHASTFHTWCMSLLRRAPAIFGSKGYTVIDRDDQLQLFKIVRGHDHKQSLPKPAMILDLYSFARNTLQPLDEAMAEKLPNYLIHIKEIAEIMVLYENRKKERRYLDYDDILDAVAQRINSSDDAKDWVASHYDYLLIDEMQDTNPLQWQLINPLKNDLTLFCVGDDAQSIYRFRGADFKNIHSFQTRVQGSTVLKLQDNYRSTQEILDPSNWLLRQSPLNYNKVLKSVRGTGETPQIHTFMNEWEEARWIAEHILQNKELGFDWKTNMILVRSGYKGKSIEAALLTKEIPYKFIGGVKLLESAHIRDVLSVLRIVGNQQDEIAWMRFLTLWQGIGEVTANNIIEQVFQLENPEQIIAMLQKEDKVPLLAIKALEVAFEKQNNVASAIQSIFENLEERLSETYEKRDWDKRCRDIPIIIELAKKHTSILAFIEEYLLDPVYTTKLADKPEDEDVVTIITIHSAKGAECERCYVIDVSPGAYPSPHSIGDEEAIEEERRVLYVALTRAKDELIVTRRGHSFWALSEPNTNDDATSENTSYETYFLNELPENLFEEHMHRTSFNTSNQNPKKSNNTNEIQVGINFGNSLNPTLDQKIDVSKTPNNNSSPHQRNPAIQKDLIHQFKQQASAQHKAFLLPANITYEADTNLLKIEYLEARHAFHMQQLQERLPELYKVATALFSADIKIEVSDQFNTEKSISPLQNYDINESTTIEPEVKAEVVKNKLLIEQNPPMEVFTGVNIDNCSAYYDEDRIIYVFGEAITSNQKPLNEYIEIHLTILDTDGEFIGREYTNWTEFGLMQSFQFKVDVSDFKTIPTKIKIYPSNG